MKKNKGSCFIKTYRASLKQNPEYSKGFTLIELMVVISLMGLLSFIVVASMDSAREKGKDAKIQSQFANLRAQSERYYSHYGMFGEPSSGNPHSGYNLCNTSYKDDYGFGGFSGPGLLRDIADTADASYENTKVSNEESGAWNQITCHARTIPGSGFDAWVVEAPFSTSSATGPIMYCVDSTGFNSIKNGTLKASPSIDSTIGFSCLPQDNNSL